MLLLTFLYIALSGNYPPAHAQVPTQSFIPVISQADPVQNEQILELNRHLDNTDKIVAQQETEISSVRNDYSRGYGMVQGFGWLLTFLVTASITIQVRKKA
jgi:hypothetical protein